MEKYRAYIRDHIASHPTALRYRITNSDQLEFYGIMPGSCVTGWYFVAHDYRAWVDEQISQDASIASFKEGNGQSRMTRL